MILRPRQREFVDRCVEALRERGNTFGVAPTAAGKTIMLSFIARAFRGSGIVLQHLIELIDQNRAKFSKCYPEARVGLITADTKAPLCDIDGWTFGMQQTLVRHPELVRPWDLVIIDEAHHAAAASYDTIIERVKELNPKAMVLGLSATPNRADGKALRKHFSNVADQIFISELIISGHLVQPRCFVRTLPDVRDGIAELRHDGSDYDMEAASDLMNTLSQNERMVEEWEKLAHERQTIVFGCDIAHAEAIADAWAARGYTTGLVHSRMGSEKRDKALAAFRSGDIQVMTNCSVLTEGFDHQPVSCIVLARPSSSKPVVMQMVGRGFRTVDPTVHPGIIKSDCVLLDFGTSLEMIGDLEQEPKLEGKGDKECPECHAMVPRSSPECPLCGHVFVKLIMVGGGGAGEPEIIDDFTMREIRLIDTSPFRWEDLDGVVTIAKGFNAWAVVIYYQNSWYCVGASRFESARLIAHGPVRYLALAAGDDWMRANENDDTARKSKRWLNEPMSDKQAAQLGVVNRLGVLHVNKYKAGCYMTWKFNAILIRKIVTHAASATNKVRAA